MSFMVCPSCQAQIDISELAPGTKVTCAECSNAVVVNRQTALLDASDAQDAIARARGRMKADEMATIQCPNCDEEMHIKKTDHVSGATFRCLECGQKILMTSKPGAKGSETVAFPTLGSEGTLLDMGDTKQTYRKPPDKKK